MRHAFLPAMLLVALAGCQKTGTTTQAPAPAPAAPAAKTVDTATPAPAPADGGQQAQPPAEPPPPLEFEVMLDNGRGADATINEIKADNQRVFVADVPESGIKAMDKPCEPGQRFQAEPKVPAFLRTEILPCAASVKFTLYSVQAMNAIIRSGDAAMDAGNFQLAQSSYGLAADYIEYTDTAQAAHLRTLAATAAGRVLGVDRPLEQGNSRPSAAFKDRVRQFQSEQGLEATGELDAPTRDSIGRMKLQGTEVVVAPIADAFPATLAAEPAGETEPAAPAAAAAQSEVPTNKLIDSRIRASEALRVPASPETAELARINRSRAMTKAGGNK